MIAANAILVSGLVFKEYVGQAGISWRDIYPPKLFVWLLLATGLSAVAQIFIKRLPASWVWVGATIVPMGLLLGALAFIVFRTEIKEALQRGKKDS